MMPHIHRLCINRRRPYIINYDGNIIYSKKSVRIITNSKPKGTDVGKLDNPRVMSRMVDEWYDYTTIYTRSRGFIELVEVHRWGFGSINTQSPLPPASS